MPKNRVLIIGASGSGKSYIARKISRKLKIPHIEVDKIYWINKKGGPINPKFKQDLLKQIETNDEFVVEGLLKFSHSLLMGKIEYVVKTEVNPCTLLKNVLRRGLNRNTWNDLRYGLSNNAKIQREEYFKKFIASGSRDLTVNGSDVLGLKQ